MKRHALFVGVNNYVDTDIHPLNFAVNDATDLAGFFRHRANFDRAEVLPDPRNYEVVLDRVHDMLDGLGAGDEFLFFFAGHGVTTQDGHRLVCSGDRLARVKRSWAGLPLELLKDETAGAFNRLFMLDACRTDVLATNRGVAGAMGNGTRDLIMEGACPAGAKAGSLTILCSCDDGECAGESSQLRHGLFSMALLDLLEEEKCNGRRVLVTDDFAYRQLPERMCALAKNSGMESNQKPQKEGPPILILDGVAPQSSAPPPPSYHQPIATPPTLVLCPECGKKNHPEDTFKCRECGKDNLCLRHQDEDTFLCAECAAAKRAERAEREAEERRAREEEGRKAREAALRNGTCPETGICRTLTLPGGAEMEMIYCPPGEFLMGSPENEEGRDDDGNETQHRVRLTKGFWLGKYPVTQRQWQSVMGKNPSRFTGDDALPVEKVSWNDCQAFIEKVNASLGCGARLPTEAEWEYACRAGTTTAYFWGSALNGDKANCDGNYPCGTKKKGPCLDKTTPVGRYTPNPWGFYDMHGNVWEWCNDRYGDYPSGSVTNPTGSASGDDRVLRGGGWSHGARDCRSAYRFSYYPGYRSNYGFRLSCSAGPRGPGAEP